MAVTAQIRLAAALDSAVAEARRVRTIEADAGRGVVDAGATVTGKVEARVERVSEAEGGATVEVRRRETGTSSVGDGRGTEERRRVDVAISKQTAGRLTLTDDHERFEASADYSLYGTDATVGKGLSGLRIGPVSWTIHQIFQIETIQFSQRVEGETLWQGYSVTLTEVSPVTGETLERWIVPHDQIDASYVPTSRSRRWAMFTEAGFNWQIVDDNPGFYGAVGLRWVSSQGS